MIRENNQEAGKTWTWTYDNAGNILCKSEYAYTTGELGEVLDTVTYGYGDEDWGDLLTSYDGRTFTYDEIGNPLSDGIWTYTWEHGRQLASMTGVDATITYTYDSDGMRIGKTVVTANEIKTYSYVYTGAKLMQEVVVTTAGEATTTDTLNYYYGGGGLPLAVTHNGTTYYYTTNLQGDIMTLVDVTGSAVVVYSYDAWGNILATTGSLATTLGEANSLRYRSYVYDRETKLYYLQSRYYNSSVGRFLNADIYISTGQGILGNNMFAYCHNNPVIYADNNGEAIVDAKDTGVDASDDEIYKDPGGAGGGNQQSGAIAGSSSGTDGPHAGSTTGNSTSGNRGTAQAPKLGFPGSTYTQEASDGTHDVISQTTYNEYQMPGTRIDYRGRSHNGIPTPHIHIFSYTVRDTGVFRCGETVMQIAID